MTTPSTSPPLVLSKPRGGEGLWYALLAPPAAWAIQEWLGWYFGQRNCHGLAPSSIRWILAAVSAAALLAALAGVARGVRLWRERGLSDLDHHDRVDFMAFGGLLVSGIFAIGIVWAGLATAFLSDCGRMR